MDDWEKELAVISGDLARVGVYLGHSSRITGRVERSKQKFLQAQIKLQRVFDQMSQALGGQYLLLLQEKAVVHWCKIYLEKVKSLHQIRQQTMTRALWIKLLKARILGAESSDQQLLREPESEDMISLAVRHAQLQNTEQELKAQLASIEARKAGLRERYYKLGIIQANIVASRTLSPRFDGRASGERIPPVLQTIGKAFVQARWSFCQSDRERAFAQSLANYVKAAEETLEKCQNLTLLTMRESGQEESHQETRDLGVGLAKLTVFEAEVQASLSAMMAQGLPPLRPIIVQKSRKKDKTIAPKTV